MIPANATTFGGSRRLSLHPQLWVLDCFVRGTADSSSRNKFVHVGGCDGQEICFDGPTGAGTMPNAVCVEDAPVWALGSRQNPLPDQVRNVRYINVVPPWHLAYKPYKYLQLVLTNHANRSVPFKAMIIALRVLDKDGKWLAGDACEECSSLTVEFPPSKRPSGELTMSTYGYDDIADVHVFFA